MGKYYNNLYFEGMVLREFMALIAAGSVANASPFPFFKKRPLHNHYCCLFFRLTNSLFFI